LGSYEEAAGASALEAAGAVLAGEEGAPPAFLPRPVLRVAGALRGEAFALRGEAADLRGEAVFLAPDFLGEEEADVLCRLAAGAFLGEAAALFLPVTEPEAGLLRVPGETLLGPVAEDAVDPDAFFEVLVLLLAAAFFAGFLAVLAFFLGPVDFLAADPFLAAGALAFLLMA